MRGQLRMGFRFHRSIRILPGIRVNFGKRSGSVSLGLKGAHVTFGTTGTRTTLGLPGNGLSYTHLERPHHAAHIVPHLDPGASKVTARGWLWVALLVAVIFTVAVQWALS
jgi:hypothetical protein